jgi:acetyl-CoA carboxylase biotin carboxyl carrier protein
MSISHDDVQRIVRLLEDSSFDELKLELDGLKLELRRRGATPAAPPQAAPAAAAVAQVAAAAPPAPAASAANPALLDIKAPMLGTFYRAPKPGADAFVAVGGRVAPDTVVGIIEVMKLMNSVAAGVSGEVVDIVAPDGQLVEFDQVLIRVRP